MPRVVFFNDYGMSFKGKGRKLIGYFKLYFPDSYDRSLRRYALPGKLCLLNGILQHISD